MPAEHAPELNEALEIFKLIDRRLDGMDKERAEARVESNKKLDEIHTQTLATNGRMTRMELRWERLKGALTLIAFGCTVAGATVVSHFWPH